MKKLSPKKLQIYCLFISIFMLLGYGLEKNKYTKKIRNCSENGIEGIFFIGEKKNEILELNVNKSVINYDDYRALRLDDYNIDLIFNGNVVERAHILLNDGNFMTKYQYEFEIKGSKLIIDKDMKIEDLKNKHIFTLKSEMGREKIFVSAQEKIIIVFIDEYPYSIDIQPPVNRSMFPD